MSVQPQHTFLLHDLRPTKEAMHSVLDRVARGETSQSDAMRELKALAESIPDLDADRYVAYQSKLLFGRNIDRARRLVNCLNDRTIKPWARVSFQIGRFVIKWGVIFGVIYVVARSAM